MDKDNNIYELSFAKIKTVLHKHRYFAIGFPLLCLVVVVFYLQTRVPLWESTANFEIGRIISNSEDPDQYQLLETPEQIRNRLIGEKFVNTNFPQINLETIKNNLKIDTKNPDIFSIKYSSESSELAADTLKKISVKLAEEHRKLFLKRTDKIRKEKHFAEEILLENEEWIKIYRKRLKSNDPLEASSFELMIRYRERESSKAKEDIHNFNTILNPLYSYETKQTGKIESSVEPVSPRKLNMIVLTLMLSSLFSFFCILALSLVKKEI